MKFENMWVLKDSSKFIFPSSQKTEIASQRDLINLGKSLIPEEARNTNKIIALQTLNNLQGVGILMYLLHQGKAVMLIPSESSAKDLISLLPSKSVSHHLKVKVEGVIEIKMVDEHRSNAMADMETEIRLSEICQHGGTIMCSSGSTGKPKVIAHTIEQIISGAQNIKAAYEICETDIAHCVLPISHMNGLITTLITPCITGSSVIFQQAPFMMDEYFKNLAELKPSWFSASPYYLNLIASSINSSIEHSYRFIRSASAPLTKELYEKITRTFRCQFYNSMGMTESAGQIFSNLPRTKCDYGIGMPVNTETAVYKNGVIQKVGEGELLIKGPTVIKQYICNNRNSDYFIGEWLRTGDMVSIQENRYTYMTGRKKNIVNFCGLKFQIEQIEEIFKAKTGHDVYGVSIPSNTYGEQLKIFIQESQATKGNLENFYKLVEPYLYSPAIIESIAAIQKYPLLPSRKINRNLLLSSEVICEYNIHSIDIYDVAGKVDKQKVKSFIASLLGVEASDIDDNSTQETFENWDSLTSMQIACMAETNLKRDLTIDEIIDCNSIHNIYGLLKKKHNDKQSGSKRHCNEDNRLERAALKELLVPYKHDETDLLYVISNWEYAKKLGFSSPTNVISALKSLLPSSTNLIMNCFSWTFTEGRPYISDKTRSEVGLIPEAMRLYPGATRTQSAIYSYCMLKHDHKLSHDSSDCWGEGSTAYKLFNHRTARVIHMGSGFKGGSLIKGNTCCHVAELMIRSPARFTKEFAGFADFDKSGLKERCETLFVRNEQYRYKSYQWKFVEETLFKSCKTKSDQKNILAYQMQDLNKALLALMENDPLLPFQGNQEHSNLI